MVGIFGYDDGWALEAERAVEDISACVSSSSTEEARVSIGYMNYSMLASTGDGTDVNARRAFGPNYPRLQQLKRKYDPGMVFNKWFCVKPADEVHEVV